MRPTTHPTALRIQGLLHERGVDTAVVEFDSPTRTSAQAAEAIGCSVAEIAKSVVFRCRDDGAAVVVVASGINRVSEKKVEALIGARIERADAGFVRTATGFVIGGVCPVGHATAVRMLLDEHLQRFALVWAAAGTPFSIFAIAPAQLSRITACGWSDIKQ